MSLDRFPVVMDLHSTHGIHCSASYHGAFTKSGAAYGRMPEAALLVVRPLCLNYHSVFRVPRKGPIFLQFSSEMSDSQFLLQNPDLQAVGSIISPLRKSP